MRHRRYGSHARTAPSARQRCRQRLFPTLAVSFIPTFCFCYMTLSPLPTVLLRAASSCKSGSVTVVGYRSRRRISAHCSPTP
eukprot:5299197-Pyramimonas_sp.AAC.1